MFELLNPNVIDFLSANPSITFIGIMFSIWWRGMCIYLLIVSTVGLASLIISAITND